jgi:hypothetical protein
VNLRIGLSIDVSLPIELAGGHVLTARRVHLPSMFNVASLRVLDRCCRFSLSGCPVLMLVLRSRPDSKRHGGNAECN